MKKQKNLFVAVVLAVFVVVFFGGCAIKEKKPEVVLLPPLPPLTVMEKQQKVRGVEKWYKQSIENQKMTIDGYDQFLNHLSVLNTEKTSEVASVSSAIDKNLAQIDRLTEENRKYSEKMIVLNDHITGIGIMTEKTESDRSLALDDLQRLEVDYKTFLPESVVAGVQTIAESVEPKNTEESFKSSKEFFLSNFPEIKSKREIAEQKKVEYKKSNPINLSYKQPSFEIRNGTKKRKSTHTAENMQEFLKEKASIVSVIADTKRSYKNSVLYLRNKNSSDTKEFVKRLKEIIPLMEGIKIFPKIEGQKRDILLVVGDDELRDIVKSLKKK